MLADKVGSKHDVYLAGTGSYSPGAPIPFSKIDTVLGRLTEISPKLSAWVDRMKPIMEEMLGVEYVHYAIDPETRLPTDDNVTMASKAAEKALSMAGLKATDIDLVVYAGIMMENMCPPTTTLIQEKLQIPRVAEYAIHSNCTSVYKAIQLASDQIALGRYRNALIMSSQLSSAFLRAEHFNQKILEKSNILLRWFLSDGSGALVLTSDRPAGGGRFKLLDTYNESIGLGLGPDMYCLTGGHRVQPLECYEKGWHHLSQNFDNVARLSVELGKNAGNAMIKRFGLEWKQVKYFIINVPTRHILDQAVTDMRREHNNPDTIFYSKLAERGYPGPAAIMHALDDFSRDHKPQPGDILASVVAESSKWMYGGFAFEYVGP